MAGSLLITFAVLLVSWASPFVSSFAVRPLPSKATIALFPGTTRSTGASTLWMGAGEVKANDEPSITNPSTAFGTPLTEKQEELNRSVVGFLKQTIFDTLFAGEGRDYARFYALETIARVPYFSYLSALHFYETIGRWRKANYLKIHFAESWNEMHHLLTMEELGGSDRWFDRFVTQHIAVSYYWIVLAIYLYNPTMAYNLNQAVEEHAFATYDQFVKEHGEELKKLPAPQVAKEYYETGDLYMFDEIQTEQCQPRRPVINNLHDVFVAIRDDEWEHVKTMEHLQTDMEVTTPHDTTCEIPPEMLQGA